MIYELNLIEYSLESLCSS